MLQSMDKFKFKCEKVIVRIFLFCLQIMCKELSTSVIWSAFFNIYGIFERDGWKERKFSKIFTKEKNT